MSQSSLRRWSLGSSCRASWDLSSEKTWLLELIVRNIYILIPLERCCHFQISWRDHFKTVTVSCKTVKVSKCENEFSESHRSDVMVTVFTKGSESEDVHLHLQHAPNLTFLKTFSPSSWAGGGMHHTELFHIKLNVTILTTKCDFLDAFFLNISSNMWFVSSIVRLKPPVTAFSPVGSSRGRSFTSKCYL